MNRHARPLVRPPTLYESRVSARKHEIKPAYPTHEGVYLSTEEANSNVPQVKPVVKRKSMLSHKLLILDPREEPLRDNIEKSHAKLERREAGDLASTQQD